MSKIDIQKLMKKNKSYCNMAFNEIYTNSAGNYKLCCHAKRDKALEKYNSAHTPPFEFFFSPEMEKIRNKMMSGEKIEACEPCYKLEESTGKSYRNTKYATKYKLTSLERNIGIKLRINGSFCNLGCYMCNPYNSSTRRNELKAVFNDLSFFTAQSARAIKSKDWNDNTQDILNNIASIKNIHMTGGEPLQLPKHWEFLDKIPNEDAKEINLSYDTNLTELSYKNKSIFDYVGKFKNVMLGVSCDHFKDKEAWIRYPIDIKKFEENLIKAKSIITHLNCTVSLLNIFDLLEIEKYYKENFDLNVTFKNVVSQPEYLSIRNLNQNDKDMLLEKYIKLDDYSFIKNQLLLPKSHELDIMKRYCDKLSEYRKFDWRKLWSEYDR